MSVGMNQRPPERTEMLLRPSKRTERPGEGTDDRVVRPPKGVTGSNPVGSTPRHLYKLAPDQRLHGRRPSFRVRSCPAASRAHRVSVPYMCPHVAPHFAPRGPPPDLRNLEPTEIGHEPSRVFE